MCGRFTLKTPVLDWLCSLLPQFHDHWSRVAIAMLEQSPQLCAPRYNIAPTQSIWVLLSTNEGDPPSLRAMRWGLVPSWADAISNSYAMFNARCETLREKPSFRNLLTHHRCIIMADGYFEWQSNAESPNSKLPKTPYWIHRDGERPFAMAGLWTENLRIDPTAAFASATVITTASNPDTRTVHDRMPVLLDRPEQIQRWLDLALEPEALDPFWTPAPSGTLHLRHVSARVNSPRHDGQDLIEPVETPPQSYESE